MPNARMMGLSIHAPFRILRRINECGQERFPSEKIVFPLAGAYTLEELIHKEDP
jgi:hypothetical protein